MRTVRLLFLSTLAATAISIMGAAASASAAPCKKEGTTFVVCAEFGSPLALELVATAVTLLGAKKAASASKLKITGVNGIECENAEVTAGELTAPPTEVKGLVLKFSGSCKAETEPTKCEVTEPIETKKIKGTLSLEGGALDVLFVSEETTGEFAQVTIKNKGAATCTGKITAGVVTGAQLCTDAGAKRPPWIRF